MRSSGLELSLKKTAEENRQLLASRDAMQVREPLGSRWAAARQPLGSR